jgi:hypothetical protein
MRSVRTGGRGVETQADPSELSIDPAAVRLYRIRAGGLATRLAAGSERHAAWAGLQDTWARSALLELHARMELVGPDGWEATDLAQVWFRRAAYVVPRQDLDVFTLGALPRDREHSAALSHLVEDLLRVLGGRPRSYAEIEAAGFDVRLIRLVGPTGRVVIRWDASTTQVLPADRPKSESEPARLELARRFLRWHGPATERQFAIWASVSAADARTTWDRLQPELVPVSLDGGLRWQREEDIAGLLTGEPVEGVRLLAPDDPLLYLDRGLVMSDSRILGHVDPAAVGQSLVNSLTGRILVDGRLVGAWGRNQRVVTLAPFESLAPELETRVAMELEALAGPLGVPPEVRWLR